MTRSTTSTAVSTDDSLVQGFQTLSLCGQCLIDDATETFDKWLNQKAERKWIFNVWDACLMGYFYAVQTYLRLSPEAHFLVHGIDDKGNTALIRAAAAEDIGVVNSKRIPDLLVQYGADVNAQNNKGRTALMEAALWGRLTTVKFLLGKGAQWNVWDEKDDRALDFAKETAKRISERRQRKRKGSAPNEREAVDENYRLRIVDLLERQDGWLQQSRLERGEYFMRFMRTGSAVPIHEMYIPLDFTTGKPKNKAFACLLISNNPKAYTMSGYAHDRSLFGVEDGRDLTNRVIKLAANINWNSNLDENWACHAELQLVAWYLHRYSLEIGSQDAPPRTDRQEAATRRIIIVVDRECCETCVDFIKAVNTETLRCHGFQFFCKPTPPGLRYA
jgi:hypothetical protein